MDIMDIIELVLIVMWYAVGMIAVGGAVCAIAARKLA